MNIAKYFWFICLLSFSEKFFRPCVGKNNIILVRMNNYLAIFCWKFFHEAFAVKHIVHNLLAQQTTYFSKIPTLVWNSLLCSLVDYSNFTSTSIIHLYSFWPKSCILAYRLILLKICSTLAFHFLWNKPFLWSFEKTFCHSPSHCFRDRTNFVVQNVLRCIWLDQFERVVRAWGTFPLFSCFK